MLAIDAEIAALPPATGWDRVAIVAAGGVVWGALSYAVDLLGYGQDYVQLMYLLILLVALRFPIVRHGMTTPGRKRLRLEREQARLADVTDA